MTEPVVLARAAAAAFGYRGRALLRDVELELRAGELLAVVGPNGSGKTTLLRGLVGLLQPLSGVVECDRAHVGYVPQRESLDPLYPLQALEVVEMGAYRRLTRSGGISAIDAETARACLARVGLAERAGEPFASLSGGQRQRVLIARALLMAPRLLFLDEPTSGADPAANRRVLELLRELAVERGLGVVLVTHQLAQLESFADGALFVHAGGVERVSLAELRDPERLQRLYAGAGSELPAAGA